MSAEAEAETTAAPDGDTTMGALAHWAALSVFVTGVGSILGPALIWFLKKDEDAFVDANGRQAINFQITWLVIGILAGASTLVVIGFLLLPLVGLAWLILTVRAGLTANNGEVATYEVGGYPTKIDIV